ncbi:peptidase S41-like protein [Mucilaginibacter gracilis]|uniref:Peptidase S41-like protein n=1 Tax=Mucilaginibacter gracilis TaxID=423350 RepID=A0A495J357_9SPHI|nr:S41 family peptidase [Mucilaginibacter gracilis]RKR83367.1 peptidase S41-like protein [Mucilaginibacter gracilis]
MIKKIISLCFILFQSGLVFCQQLSKADYLADLYYLKDTLPKRHINLFAKISKADFEHTIAAMAARLTDPDMESFTVELYKLPVAIGDEHTHIEPVFTKAAPIRFDKFSEGIFVTATDSADTDVLLYKLDGINGHPIGEVISRFKAIIQSGNSSFFDSRFLHLINNPVMLKGLQLTGSTDETSFDLTAPNGKTTRRVMKSVPGTDAGNLPLVAAQKQQRKGNYWDNYDARTGTLYFNYNNCQDNDAHPFAAFNNALFALIDQKKPKRLVIDLRDNSGGNSGVLTPFIDSVKRSYLNAKGKLFVLIGKQTFSSALMNAVDFKRNTNAILLGEATSGTVNHYGEVRGFRLPHTKIVIGYSTRYWENWKGHDGPLMPDVAIAYSVKNFGKGIDEALVYAEK